MHVLAGLAQVLQDLCDGSSCRDLNEEMRLGSYGLYDIRVPFHIFSQGKGGAEEQCGYLRCVAGSAHDLPRTVHLQGYCFTFSHIHYCYVWMVSRAMDYCVLVQGAVQIVGRHLESLISFL